MAAWGLHGMHKIRPKLQKTSKHPRDILGRMLYERFSNPLTGDDMKNRNKVVSHLKQQDAAPVSTSSLY